METPKNKHTPETEHVYRTPLIASEAWAMATADTEAAPTLCAKFEAEQPAISYLLRDCLGNNTSSGEEVAFGMQIATTAYLALSHQEPNRNIPIVLQATAERTADFLYPNGNLAKAAVDFQGQHPGIIGDIYNQAINAAPLAANPAIEAIVITLQCIEDQVNTPQY